MTYKAKRPGGPGLTHAEALLLNDVCVILGLSEAEAQQVVGFGWHMLHMPDEEWFDGE